MSYTRNPRTGSKQNIRTSNGPAPEWPGTIRHLTPEQYREEVLGLPPLPPEPRHWKKLVALALVCGFAVGYCAPTVAQELRDPYYNAIRPGTDPYYSRYPFQSPAQASRQLDAEREARRYQDRQLDAIDAAARRAEQAADQRDFQRRLDAIYGR